MTGAIETMSGRDQQILRLRDRDHATYKAIGAAIGISATRARFEYLRALKRLARRIGKPRTWGGDS